jgi:hypothetical protein
MRADVKPCLALLLTLVSAICVKAQSGELAEARGLLIVRGELVRPPYTIAVVNGAITVNGRTLDYPGSCDQPVARASVTDASPLLWQHFWDWWNATAPLDGVDATADASRWFLLSFSLVAGVERVSNNALRVRFARGAAETVELTELEPRLRSEPPAAAVLDVADHWRRALQQGALVIASNEGRWFISRRSEPILQAITEAAAISSIEARYKKLRSAVPDDELARELAEHVQPK